MSTIKTVNVIHPSGVTNNIVTDASGNVAVGGALTVSGVAAVAVAPGTSGNLLTSNGTVWTSAAPAASGVTSITAGTGLTGGTITTTGTIAVDIYTGTTANNTSYPIGSYIAVYATYATLPANSTRTIFSPSTSGNRFSTLTEGAGSSALTGTWRARGLCSSRPSGCDDIQYYIHQRTA